MSIIICPILKGDYHCTDQTYKKHSSKDVEAIWESQKH